MKRRYSFEASLAFPTHHLLKRYFKPSAVIEEAYERVIVDGLYCDIPLGLYIIRGENVVLIGELVKTFLYTNKPVSLAF